MNIEVLQLGTLGTNCYLLSGEKFAIVIDPGDISNAVLKFLEDNSDKQRLILLTHCHFDHIGGALWLREKTGVEVAIGEGDAYALSDPEANLSESFGMPLRAFYADTVLLDGEEKTVGDISFKVFKTAGHTKGDCCYLFGNDLFCGDVLFYGSIGRTDFINSDPVKMMASLHLLMEFNDEIKVYPGHGPLTTIGRERRSNPYLV